MAADIIPLNFSVLADWRNWLLVAFVIFIVGALVHYLLPIIAGGKPSPSTTDPS